MEGTMAETQATSVGLVGLYDDPDTLLCAARKVRQAGYVAWDCHTPYPVHGLDEAMGLRPSRVPFVTITAGFVGLAVAIALTGGINAIYCPIRIGGKPLFSWQAFVPIYFELFVLCAAVATMGALVAFCRLGRWHSPLHDSGVMSDITSNRFAIVIEARDTLYSEDTTRVLLEETGCRDIRPLVEIESDEPVV
jgi:Alternative complex III, ActD subunit